MIREFRAHGHDLPVERCCQLLSISRSGFYHRPDDRGAREWGDQVLTEEIERIVLQLPGYGYRRVTAQLRREGWQVNEKRILRLMRDNSLLCQLQRRWTRTTDSEHGLRVWPNLLPELTVVRPDQVWVADLTYIRLPSSFCYLAALLDACSRRVIGWELSRRLDAGVAVAALRQALANRCPRPGWVHHSDRGVQYACRDYVSVLERAGARISMSRRGRPRDNAQAEAFFRTLKCEEVYLQDYRDFDDAELHLARFIDEVYNRKRLHSSLGYVPPCEFEDPFAGLSDGA